MGNKHLSKNPQRIDRLNWYYEEKRGIIFVHEIRDERDIYIRTDQIIIPWGKIITSVNRKLKKDKNA